MRLWQPSRLDGEARIERAWNGEAMETERWRDGEVEWWNDGMMEWWSDRAHNSSIHSSRSVNVQLASSSLTTLDGAAVEANVAIVCQRARHDQTMTSGSFMVALPPETALLHFCAGRNDSSSNYDCQTVCAIALLPTHRSRTASAYRTVTNWATADLPLLNRWMNAFPMHFCVIQLSYPSTLALNLTTCSFLIYFSTINTIDDLWYFSGNASACNYL